MKRRTKRKLIIAGVIALILLTVLVVLAWDIVHLSYVSMASVCYPQMQEKFESQGFVTLGVFTGSAGNTTVQVFVNPKYEELHRRVLKHELIHKRQYEQGRSFLGCSLFGVFSYVNELEAYTFQNLPDRIFEKLYGTIAVS